MAATGRAVQLTCPFGSHNAKPFRTNLATLNQNNGHSKGYDPSDIEHHSS